MLAQCQAHNRPSVCDGILVHNSGHHKILQAGWLEPQKFVFSWFWSLKVQDQGAGKFGFSCALALAPRCCCLAVSSHGLCVWASRVPSSSPYKDTGHFGLGSQS